MKFFRFLSKQHIPTEKNFEYTIQIFTIKMAYEMMVIHHPRMPFLFGGIFTEYPYFMLPYLHYLHSPRGPTPE